MNNESRYITIKNKKAVLVVDKIGAQIVSYKIDGMEVMFDGATNPDAQWRGTAKNLFPNPGPMGTTNSKYGELNVFEEDTGTGKPTKFTEYFHNGGIYKAEQHGFAQKSVFDVQGKNIDSVVLSLSADQNTVKYYPYDFKYYVCYSLGDNGELNYTTRVQNNDNKDMLAGMGWHPAFKLHGNPNNYKLVVKNLVKGDNCNLENGEYEIYESVIKQGKSVKFSGIKSADIYLVYYNDKGQEIPYIKMQTEKGNLVLWSKPKTNNSQDDFICIEPWNTTPRQLNELTEQHKTKELASNGAVIIKPGEACNLNASVGVSSKYIKALKQIVNDSSKE